jgi:predicted DCC family thiol-disulfide oxidoreductase YuxK
MSDNWILYDGDCPFCRNYVQFLQLRKNIGSVRLVNARDNTAEMHRVTLAGINIDQGMVLCYSDSLYHGDQCMHMLALLSESSTIIGKFYAWLFASPNRASLLYPFLRSGRNLSLRLLGKSKLNNLAK